jgi:hypothetical protein
MLHLKLRQEFSGEQVHGTMVDFTNPSKTGALEVSTKDFLKITYPSIDLLQVIESILPDKRRPIVLLGDRGQGKSHLMATVFHLFKDISSSIDWLTVWKPHVQHGLDLSSLEKNFIVIAENLQSQNYNSLWNLLFDRHPEGNYFRGKWEGDGSNKTPVPGSKLIREMLSKQPVALILDEFQTWFEGKFETKENPSKTHAFNFIQILSEIATDSPGLLLLMVSVRESNSDAAQQIYRINPIRVAFNNPQTKKDRLKLLLYRIFENRLQIDTQSIESVTDTFYKEYIRLKEIPSDRTDKLKASILEAWSFSPDLIQLLEDQILISVNAQETRDLIRILVELYRFRGEHTPIITPSDFLIKDKNSTAGILLDSVANREQRNLKEKAQRNLEALEEISSLDKDFVFIHQLISSLWFRSLSVGKLKGANPIELQLDITKDTAWDDNKFQSLLISIEENSFNIHKEGDRLVFKNEENPYSKIVASAKNDKLFTSEVDIKLLLKEIRFIFCKEEGSGNISEVIPLGKEWENNPWTIEKLDSSLKLDNFKDTKIPILIIIPESVEGIDSVLGKWLSKHIPTKRNIIRFVLPTSGSLNYCLDRDLVLHARVVYLAEEWKGDYKSIGEKFKTALRKKLMDKFDTVAILEKWNYQNPEQCKFFKIRQSISADKIIRFVDEKIRNEFFAMEDFETILVELAEKNYSFRKVLDELKEPVHIDNVCIPYIGEQSIIETIYYQCAKGKIAVHYKGTEIIQSNSDEDVDTIYNRIKKNLPFGRDLEITKVLIPNPVTQSTMSIEQQPTDDKDNTKNKDQQTSPQQPGSTVKNIFSKPNTIRRPKQTHYTSSINLINEIEKWNIEDKNPVHSIKVSVETTMDKKQLRRLLEKLPDGFKYKLELEVEEKE